jgi:hypothetical protein
MTFFADILIAVDRVVAKITEAKKKKEINIIIYQVYGWTMTLEGVSFFQDLIFCC